jgi:hypothetical protein
MATVTFGAVGDIAFHKGIAELLEADGPGWPFAAAQPALDRAGVLFGNFEFPFLPPDFPTDEIDPAGALSVVPGPEGAGALREAGFDVLNLAANHVLDAGTLGLDYTRRCLRDAGICAGGVGYSQEEARSLEVIECDGLTFGVLCYAEDGNWTLGATNPGPAYYTLDTVLEDLQRYRNEVDVLVVSIHGDIEFLPTPAPVRIANSRRIAAAGADILLEHHPHVPQGIEMVDGSLIAYSLGNFVFGVHTDAYIGRHLPHTGESFVLLVEVDGDGVRAFERVPCLIGQPPLERPRILEGVERAELAAYYGQLDAWLQDEEFVRETWRRRVKAMFASYIKQAAGRDVEEVLDDMVGRAVLVAENRSWADEVLAMAGERWETVGEPDLYHRPNYRFQKRRSAD